MPSAVSDINPSFCLTGEKAVIYIYLFIDKNFIKLTDITA